MTDLSPSPLALSPLAPSLPAPLVSVLTTTYNGARFIAETIDSVLAQGFRDFELVVVDDNSTDDTAAILARYTDPRLRVLRNAGNLGVVGGRNRGFAELRGTFVATIDHDDLWLPARLEAGLAALRADPALVLVGTQTLALTGGRLWPVNRPSDPSPVVFRWMLLMDCPVTYSSLLFRKDAATRPDGTLLRPDLRYADDYELMLRLAGVGTVATLPEALTIYRLHAGNTTLHVMDEMCRHAVTALTETIAPWLGDDAAEAARLIAWHVTRGRPVERRADLCRLSVLLRRLMDAYIAACRPDPDERARIERHTRHVYWRAMRAGIRGGHPWLLGADRGLAWDGGVPSLGQAVDLAGSVATGGARLLARTLTRAKG